MWSQSGSPAGHAQDLEVPALLVGHLELGDRAGHGCGTRGTSGSSSSTSASSGSPSSARVSGKKPYSVGVDRRREQVAIEPRGAGVVIDLVLVAGSLGDLHDDLVPVVSTRRPVGSVLVVGAACGSVDRDERAGQPSRPRMPDQARLRQLRGQHRRRRARGRGRASSGTPPRSCRRFRGRAALAGRPGGCATTISSATTSAIALSTALAKAANSGSRRAPEPNSTLNESVLSST